MGAPPDALNHPIFGEVRWQEEYGWWFAQVRDAAGEWLDVVIEPDEGDRRAVIEPAAQLSTRALKAERQIIKAAIRSELLELYNDTWRQEGERKLTADQLLGRLEFVYIGLRPTWDVPIILSYAAGDLFGGHSVDVEADLQVIDTGLVG
jgi:hypothetical protein